MEALYAKLYDKYTKLKKKNFSEFDEVHKEQEEKFLEFVSASEQLIQHLRSEKENLAEMVEGSKSEITSIRSNKYKECMEYQKLLVEKEQKIKALSKEVEKLKELNQEGRPHNNKDQSGSKQKRKTPESPQVTTQNMRKRRRQSSNMVETDMEQYAETTCDGSSSSSSYTFQALGEHLLRMKLSTETEGGRVYIIATHPPSGLSFSLTLVNKSTGEESEILYKVVSLGTFERLVPEWMKEDMRFNTSMCPVFFERVSRVISLKC
ncbi:unnamed protein product [Cochlearia groenlandica]